MINAYIGPLIHAQFQSGMSKTLYVLVPSNASINTRTGSIWNNRKVVEGYANDYNKGRNFILKQFGTTEIVKIVYLRGEEYKQEFWRQLSVVTELHAAVTANFEASGLRVKNQGFGGDKLGSDEMGIQMIVEPLYSPKRVKVWNASKQYQEYTGEVLFPQETGCDTIFIYVEIGS
jgi:hypothetical protein